MTVIGGIGGFRSGIEVICRPGEVLFLAFVKKGPGVSPVYRLANQGFPARGQAGQTRAVSIRGCPAWPMVRTCLPSRMAGCLAVMLKK